MKKILSLILMVVLVLGVLVACSGGQEQSSSTNEGAEPAKEEAAAFPDKPVNVIVAYDAGGGTDTTARALQPYLEEALGVTVNILNQPGGSGWVGWTNIANAAPDGYTIGYLNSPNIASGLVNPTLEKEVGLEDFQTIGNHVADPGAVVIRADEDRFSTFEELVDYAKTNELTTTATGVAGDDHLVTLKLNEKLGTQFRAIQFEGTAESRSAFLGGHVDILITSVGEAYPMHEEKALKVVAVTADKKSPFLPDVPTVEEAGYEAVISQSTRGLAAPVGIDAEKLEVLQTALETAVNNAEHAEKMKELGIQVDYRSADEYKGLLEQDVVDIEGLKGLLGW